jgi:hypothetical protein
LPNIFTDGPSRVKRGEPIVLRETQAAFQARCHNARDVGE